MFTNLLKIKNLQIKLKKVGTVSLCLTLEIKKFFCRDLKGLTKLVDSTQYNGRI